jgi:hypothetical protein
MKDILGQKKILHNNQIIIGMTGIKVTICGREVALKKR